MRSLLVTAAVTLGCLLGPAATAGTAGPVSGTPATGPSPEALAAYPLEDLAAYQPQTGCAKRPKPGTVALGAYLVATYGGGGGAVNRPCTGSSTSEHKDGRAIDWTLDATVPAHHDRADAFLQAAFAPDDAGQPAALARRMGIMYVIWDDTMYAAWNGFAPERYLSSSCTSRKRCSKTLRHRDHVHVSLSKAGARGQTSFYLALIRGSSSER